MNISPPIIELATALQHVEQMLIFQNSEILWRDAYVLKNYLAMKTKIAFLLNLERPITATTKVFQPGLPQR